MNLLQEARDEIDQIDQQMAQLFVQRMNAVKNVVAYKKEHNLPILDTSREQAVIEKNMARLPQEAQAELFGFYKEFIIHNMAVAKAFQRQIIAKDCVAYQGVAGAFSHIAKQTLFPHAPDKAFDTWKEVFTAVDTGSVTYGVLPFENSHAGDVSEVLDLCFSHPHIHVCSMYDLPVHQNLLGIHGATVQDIKTVVSHPQALAQSAEFLERLGVTTQTYPNTAAAASYVADLNDISVAAIASVQTAELYHLSLLAEKVNQSTDNTTRFLVITKEAPTIGNRFSLLFTVKHQAGSLAQVISLVAEQGFNMESIKSRPMPHVSWEYYFYMELVGDGSTAFSLQEKLEQVCHSVRILGIYEREETT